jgi:hypothetical protein
MNATTHVGILAFRVLPHDHQVDAPGCFVAQRRFNAAQQSAGAQIDVLLERAPNRDEQSPQGDMIRHARIAHRAEEDQFEIAQRGQAVVRHHLAVGCVILTAPRELGEVEREAAIQLRRRLQDAHACGNYLFANAIAGDHRTRDSFHHPSSSHPPGTPRCATPYDSSRSRQRWKQKRPEADGSHRPSPATGRVYSAMRQLAISW